MAEGLFLMVGRIEVEMVERLLVMVGITGVRDGKGIVGSGWQDGGRDGGGIVVCVR